MKTPSFATRSFDTRTLFHVYGACAAIAGIVLLAGPQGMSTDLATNADAKRAFLQFSAVMLFALACVAAGFGEIEDPRSRHRALGCFAFAHLVALGGVVGIQALHGGRADGDVTAPLLVGLCVILFNFWQTGDGYRAGESMQFTTLFGGAGKPDQTLRSEYEARIREAAGQEERHRLARDLHDSVKQQIYAMQTAAATIAARFDTDAPGARDALERLRESGREAMAEMEAMLDSLRATTLTNAGLVEALKKQGEALQFRSGAHVTFDIGALPPDEGLAPGVQQAIFRVAQEAFANVGRHARAAHVSVRLGLDVDRLVLRIEDDGAGFEPASSSSGMGLANMRERAAAYGGRLDVRSRRGEGTAVVLSVPCADRALAELAGYRQSAIGWGIASLVIAAIVVVLWSKGARVATTASLLVANVIIFLRAWFVYERARRSAEETPWPQSPSHS